MRRLCGSNRILVDGEKDGRGDKKARTKEEGKREATSSLINEEAKQLAPQR